MRCFARFTCKRASRYSGVPFLDIETSKIGRNLRCFAHFDLRQSGVPFFDIGTSKIAPELRRLKMWIAPQWRAVFHFSAEQLSTRPLLYQGYFSNIRNHESLKERNDSRLSSHFARASLLSSDSTYALTT